MEEQKLINLLDDITIQPSKCRTRNWVKINDESKRTYDDSNIRQKTSIVKSNLCEYNDVYVLVKGTITVPNTAAACAAENAINKKVIFKSCAPFTDSITEINNTQADDAQKINVVLSMYNLIEYSDAYLKTSRSLWQNYRDEPTLDNNVNNIDFPDDSNNSALFKFKQKITGQTGNGSTKDVEIMVPLKHLSNFWRALEMSFNNCQISLQLK